MNGVTAAQIEALLLDIGDVISAPVWDQFDELEKVLGRRFVGRGPLDPDGDPLWQRHLAGELSFYEYWIAYAAANGYENWKLMFKEVADHLPHRFSDPEAIRLMNDAKAAGYKVAVLTNDGVGISGRAFFDTLPEFEVLDAFFDARETGFAKPHPEPYRRAAEGLGLDPGQIVFLDDTPACIEGAEAVGMVGVLVDPVVRAPAFARTRELLGLQP